MYRIISIVFSLTLLIVTNGCIAAPRPQAGTGPAPVLETLSAEADFSFSNGDQGMSGSGYFIYQRPDRVRIVILSPFGTALMEVVVTGERVTVIDISQGAAFQGLLSELPDSGGTWMRTTPSSRNRRP